MELATLIGPAVVAAVVSGIVAVVALVVNRATTLSLHERRLDADKELAERKINADIALAKAKFDYDRDQAVFKRRFELAEQMLADAYRFRAIMVFARNGVAWGGDGSTRKAPQFETDGVKGSRDSYFVPQERLRAENEFFSAMFARQTVCHAHFGPEADQAFGLFQQAIHEVRTSSALLIEWTNDHETVDRELMQKMRQDIWQPMAKHTGKDEIGDKIDQGVSLVEQLCRPALAQHSQR